MQGWKIFVNTFNQIFINRNRHLVSVKCCFKAGVKSSYTSLENILIYTARIKGCNCVLIFFELTIKLFVSFFANRTVLVFNQSRKSALGKRHFFSVYADCSKVLVQINISKHAEGAVCSLSGLHLKAHDALFFFA